MYEKYLFIAFFTISTIYYFCKLVDWIEKKRQARFKSDEAEFMADCYKTQQKWAKKGCIDFAEAIGLVIRSFNMPPEREAGSDYGNTVIKEMKNINHIK
jgi:hypothetical protein